VVAAFWQATYVLFPTGIVALTTTSVPPGPIHLRGDFPTLEAGDELKLGDAYLETPIWRGDLPDDVQDAGALREAATRSALLLPPFAKRAEKARRAVAHGALDRASALLGGLGPGLTPSGDDALAGLLLAARIRWTSAAEPHLIAIAERVDTHEIARAFLHWAARGQSIEPVHRCLLGDSAAAADLRAFGHTSGADLALGLLWGLEALPRGQQ
jgi:hypothetical protein